jgi:hypothetical protein
MEQDKSVTLFRFLKRNRDYNKKLQEAFYADVITPRKTAPEKIISLLHSVANTQSKPNIDQLAGFYRKIHDRRDDLATFSGFFSVISGKPAGSGISYEDLFKSMLTQKGWGNKTAALFVKSVYHLHNGNYNPSLRIWKDAPKVIGKDEKFHLPVDAVIIFVFEQLGITASDSFKVINRFLHESGKYPSDLMEIWDDLWFWGFITQHGGGANRTPAWNENKYWALLHSDKNPDSIRQIKKKAEEFIRLLDR